MSHRRDGRVMRCGAVGVALLSGWLLLVEPANAQSPTSTPLPVPWFGQGYCQYNCKRHYVNWNGRNNCGPASAIMVGLANGAQQPQGVTRAAWVRQVKAYIKGTAECPAAGEGISRSKLDDAAAYLGLCARDELWTTTEIKDETEKCLPVVTWLSGDKMPWKHNASFYKGIDHIVVTTGFGGTSTVTINDPLDATGSLACPGPTPQGEDTVYGSANSQYAYADYDKAAYAASLGWWGRAYGDQIGTCDTPDCPGGGGGGSPTPTPMPAPNNQVFIRMSSYCADNSMDVFYVTSETPNYFHEDRKLVVPVINDGVFHSYNVVFDGKHRRNWFKGTLQKVRIDPTRRPGCLFAFSWLAVHNGTTSAKWWNFPSGQGSGGWWPMDAVTQGWIGPFWPLVSTTNDPWIENDAVNVDIDP